MSSNDSNNLDYLTNKLKELARHHAIKITNQQEEINQIAGGDCNLNELTKDVLSMEFFKVFDKVTIDRIINDLEKSVKELLNFEILTQSTHNKKQMPIAFDALVDIFTFSNETFRQQNFQYLVTLYYKELCKNLQSEQTINKASYDQQIKILLPLVKLELTIQRSKENIAKPEDDEKKLLSNIASYFKFPIINQEDIYEVVKNKIDSNDFNLQCYQLTPLSQKNGHLGEYFNLRILVDIHGDVEQFDLFAKFITAKTEVLKKMIQEGPSKKEEFFYMTYMPLLERHSLKPLLNFAPRCYFSRINDVLILDDMGVNGFEGLTPNIQLKYDALCQVVQKLANFHSATMILEEILSQKEGRRVTVQDLYSEYLQEVLFIPDDDHFMKSNFDTGLSTILYVAKKFPELTDDFSDEFLMDKINKGWKLLFDKISKSDNLKNTICHGDMYVANLLFKYNEARVCQNASLIDFQILRYCPPTHDLMFFLHQSCTKQERNQYLEQLYNEYYERLSTNINDFGFDIKNVYPRENFESSLRYMKSQAVFQALFYSPFTLLPPKLREDIFLSEEQTDYYMIKYRWKLVDIGFKDDMYKTVLKGLIEDLVELCKNGDL